MNIHTYDIGVPEGLVENVLELSRQDRGVAYSNVGGWHSTHTNFIRPWFEDTTSLILSKVDNLYRVKGYWFNINNKGDHNRWHNHSAGILVAVYYIKVSDNSGNIEFRNKKKSEIRSLTPKIGQLIMFNGEIDHQVCENKSDEMRISAAFNLTLIKKKS